MSDVFKSFGMDIWDHAGLAQTELYLLYLPTLFYLIHDSPRNFIASAAHLAVIDLLTLKEEASESTNGLWIRDISVGLIDIWDQVAFQKRDD